MAMAEGRSRQLWEHTSFLLAKIHNSLSMGQGRGKSPDDFNPHMIAEKKCLPEPTKDEVKMTFAIMKAVFVDRPSVGRASPNKPDETTVADLLREREAILKAQKEKR